MLDTTMLDDAIVDPKTYADERLLNEVFAQVRRDDPMHWTEPRDYRPFWTVSKHADIVEIERQSEIFINEPRSMLFTRAEEEVIRQQTGGRNLHVRTLVHMDNPDHRIFRGMTQSWFQPKSLRMLETALGDLAREAVDRMAGADGTFDFVREVAAWYPLRVIMTILGVPPEDEPKMLKLTQELFNSTDPELRRDANSTDHEATVKDLFAYFSALAADRRVNPKEDVATVIANATKNGEPINDLEALSYYVIVATAGHDTTSASISGGMLALLQNPEEFARLRANPDLLSSAVDEMFRWSTPVRHFFRTATQDYSLRGKQVRAGDALLLSYPSANRDEEVFDQPYRFKVDRTPVKHLAFGYGPHVCLGQFLARMELRILYAEILRRIEHVELAGAPRFAESSFVSGLKHLPVRCRVRA